MVTVGEKWVDVDCRFVFKNYGKATTVRMGFPDIGEGADSTEYGVQSSDAAEKGKKYPPYDGFEFFKSWVDGKPAKITLLKMHPTEAYSWHAKDVKFGANQTRVVHDVYRTYVGGGLTNTGNLAETSYVLYTGASWKGTIGDVDVKVVFKRKTMGSKLRLKAIPNGDSSKAFSHEGWPKEAPGTVMWSGFAKPRIEGKTLHFRAKNLEPTKASDVYVAFDYKHAKG